MAAIKGNELHTASLEGNLKTVKALLAQGDDINVNQRDQYQFCPLHYASMAGHMDVVEALVAAGQALFLCNICVVFRPVFAFQDLLFIHALTNATDDHKYSPLPSTDFDSSEVLVSFSGFIFSGK